MEAWEKYGQFSKLNKWMVIVAQKHLDRETNKIHVPNIYNFFFYQRPNYKHYVIHDAEIAGTILRMKSSSSNNNVHIIRFKEAFEYISSIHSEGWLYTNQMNADEISFIKSYNESPIELGRLIKNEQT